MPIFKDGPHTVTIYLEETIIDDYGNPVRRPSKTGIVVSGCLVHPVASTRGAFPAIDARHGQRVDASYKLVCPADTPLEWWSRVEWTAAGGAPRPLIQLTVLSGPLLRNVSAATAHITCTLQEER